jgi:hypothetical protein
MDKVLNVKHTQDRHGKPLAEIENFPGAYAELSPDQLRTLARALNQAADDCDRQQLPRQQYSLE